MKKKIKFQKKLETKTKKLRLSVDYNHSDKVIWVFLVSTIIVGILYWVI